MSVVNVGQPTFSQYILIGEGANSRSHFMPVVHVYSYNGTQLNKVQELNENIVQSMYAFYPRRDEVDSYLLMRKQESLSIYRVLPFGGLQWQGFLRLTDDLKWATVTNGNHLVLYFAPDCHEEVDSTMQPYLEILRPRYRQAVEIGHQVFERRDELEEKEHSVKEENVEMNTAH